MKYEGHTPGPYRAEKTPGWGGNFCIRAPGRNRPIFTAVKPKRYYTDYPPSPNDPDARILSTEAAERAGRYVATPEIQAQIEAEEEATAKLFAAAPSLAAENERLRRLLPDSNGEYGGPLVRVVCHYEDGSEIEIDRALIKECRAALKGEG